VDEQERPPAGPALRQPRLDVEAARLQLDLVLADRATAAIPARAATGLGRDLTLVVSVNGIVEHLVAYHSSGLMTKPVSGLG
jgi:ribosomal protein L27